MQNIALLQSDPEFVRKDCSLYISNLSQKAGVSTGAIRRLVLKELTDNALDECDRAGRPGEVTITQDSPNTYTVTDQGRGFDDTPDQLACRFSLDKPMTSSKQWRKPTRGCVGNGLRVIVGSVVDGGRKIIVKTRNKEVVLCPRLNGSTAVVSVADIDFPVGSSITIEINPSYPDNDAMLWAETAIDLAKSSGAPFTRNTSVWWLDADHLALNMLAAIGSNYTVADFVSRLDRCSDRKTGQAVTGMFGKGARCRDVDSQGAGRLLDLLREMVPDKVAPKKLGVMGEGAWQHDGYALKEGEFATEGHQPIATIPFLVECWAHTEEAEDYDDDCKIYATNLTINRSPAITSFSAYRADKSRFATCNMGGQDCYLDIPRGKYSFQVNITSPYIFILGDNKNPDLKCFKDAVSAAVNAAIKQAARNNPPTLFDKPFSAPIRRSVEKQMSQKDAVLHVLDNAIKRSRDGSDGTKYYFEQRNLFYRVRDLVKELLPHLELKYSYFTALLTDYEFERGDIDHMWRDSRGVFIEPHGGERISMGTENVKKYERTSWKYRNVFFVEKEGLVKILEQVGFERKWDCLLLSSKGYASRAAKDLIDKIAESDEETHFYVVHDGDGPGSMISQTLVQETKARGARNVHVHDIGLHPWDAMKMGLPTEQVGARRSKKTGRIIKTPVAEYVKERDRRNARNNPDNEPNWEKWFQTNRIEMDAMTSEQLVKWLDAEFEKRGAAKVIPPEKIAEDKLKAVAFEIIQSSVEDKIAEEMKERIERETREAYNKIKFLNGAEVIEKIKSEYFLVPSTCWRSAVCRMAGELVDEFKEAA